MQPVALPGVVEAENFDIGGQGVAYNDANAGNAVGEYRPDEDVDIGGSTDAGFGFAVGWTEAGEWLEFAVDAVTGTYWSSLQNLIHLEC